MSKVNPLNRVETKKAYSWWWDSHISAKNSRWMAENLEEMDKLVKEMLKLIEQEGDSFAKKAEIYYQRRPELVTHVEDFYRMYRALAERYDNVTGELSRNMPAKKSRRPTGSSTPSPVERRPKQQRPRAAGFDVFLGSSDASRKGSDSSTTSSESELDDATREETDDDGYQKRIAELESELEDANERLRVAEEEIGELKRELGKAGEESGSLRARILELEAEAKDFRASTHISAFRQAVAGVSAANAAAEELKSASDEKQALEIGITQRDRAIDELNSRIRSLELKIESSTAEFSSERLELAARIEDLSKETSELRAELTRLTSEKMELNSRIQSLQEEQTTLELKIANSTDEFSHERLEFEAKLEESSREASELKAELDLLKSEKLELNSKIQSLLEERATLKLKIEASSEESSRERSEIAAQLEEWEKETRELKAQLDELTSEKMELHSKIQSLLAERTTLELKIRSSIEEFSHEKCKLEVDSKIESLLEDGSTLELKETVELRAELERLASEKVGLEKKASLLANDVEMREETIREMEDHLHNLHLEHVRLIDESEGARRECKKVCGRVEELEEEVERQRVALSDSAEEKREVIRQLCFSLEHYRRCYEELRRRHCLGKDQAILAPIHSSSVR